MSIKKILTRRDFLGSGIVHSFGSIFLPSLATLLRNERALAAGEACSVDGSRCLLLLPLTCKVAAVSQAQMLWSMTRVVLC